MLKQLEVKLSQAFQPEHLSLIDESHKHQGHMGHRPGFVTHIRLMIISDQFQGLSRVQQHQKVYDVLAPEMKDTLHAVALKTFTPQTWMVHKRESEQG